MRTKRSKKMTKKQSQHIHFDKECMERLCHYIDQDIIIKQIKNNELILIDRQINRVTR